MDKLIVDSVSKGISYDEYCHWIKELVLHGKTTGEEQTTERIEYTKLNASRMRRLAKTVTLSNYRINEFNTIATKQTWLVITESWCADAAQTIPVLGKIAEVVPAIDLKIITRDENQELMNRFLTNGTQSIPKLIVVGEDYEVLNSWGARSTAATKLVAEYKKKHGKIDAEFKKQLQIWYNKDKGVSIVNDLFEIVKSIKISESVAV